MQRVRHRCLAQLVVRSPREFDSYALQVSCAATAEKNKRGERREEGREQSPRRPQDEYNLGQC